MDGKPSQGILRGTAIVAALTAVSRVFGFVRDLLVARLFGSSGTADAFLVAFRIPNLLRSFLAEGALTSAFVPIFSTELSHGKERAQQALSEVTGLLLAVTTLISILGIIFSQQIVALFAPGFIADTAKFELCAKLLAIMFPYIILVSIVAMLNGALNTVKVFGAAAMAQVCMNIILILGAVIAEAYLGVAAELLSWSVLVGGVIGVVIQIPALAKAGLVLKPSLRPFSRTSRELLKLMAPAILGAAVYQLAIFLNTLLASFLEEGSVSWLFYADRVVQLPIGIFTIALGSVILPTLSRAAASGESDLYNSSFVNSVRFSLFIVTPICFGLFTLAQPLTTLLFERGAFNANATAQTALAIKAYSIGLWAVGCQSMVVRAFIARKDTITPTVVGALTLISTFFFSLLFMGEMSSDQSGILYSILLRLRETIVLIHPTIGKINFGHAGLALASSLSSIFGVLLLSLILAKRNSGIAWRAIFHAAMTSVAASAVMYLSLVGLMHLVTNGTRVVIIGIPLGVVAFIVGALIFKSREITETFDLIKRRRNKSS